MLGGGGNCVEVAVIQLAVLDNACSARDLGKDAGIAAAARVGREELALLDAAAAAGHLAQLEESFLLALGV